MVPVPVIGLHHVGIVVADLDAAIETYQKLGLTFDGIARSRASSSSTASQ
jgi:hypothetical protein